MARTRTRRRTPKQMNCEIIEEGKVENTADVRVIEPPRYQSRQNKKKTRNRCSKQGKRIKCQFCMRRFNVNYDLLMHIKAKHTPKTLLMLSLKCLSLFMTNTVKMKQRNLPKSLINTTRSPVSWVSRNMSSTQNQEADKIFGSTLASSHRKQQVIKAPIKGPVSQSGGQIKSSTSTKRLHAPMEEDIELGNSWSNATKNSKNKTATKIHDTTAMRYKPNDCYSKKSLVNPLSVEQNRNTERQIIPEPSTASIQGVQGIAVTQIPPECDAGIKREKDENHSSDSNVGHKIISGGDKIFAPMPNKISNKENAKTNSDEPRMGPILNDYHSLLPTLNFKVGCNICNRYFNSDKVLLNHMKYCHVAYRCEWCGHLFSSRYWLAHHLAIIHNINMKHDKRYWRSNVTVNSKGLRRSNKASYGKVQRTFPKIKIEPAFPKIKIEPAFPNVKFEPTIPNVKVEPSSSDIKVEPILIKVEPNNDL